MEAAVAFGWENKSRADIERVLSELHIDLSGNIIAVNFLQAFQDSHAVTPILVQRLDRTDTFSYMIPYNSKNGTSVIVMLNALYGFPNEIAYTLKPFKYPRLSLKDIKNMLSEGVLEIHRRAYCQDEAADVRVCRLTIRLGTFCLNPILVWQPCWESRNPFFPFYYVTAGGRQLYIASWNGRVYDRLHPFGPRSTVRGGV